MDYEIEKGVELPKSNRGGANGSAGGRRPKYPFAKMEVGDSFVAEEKAKNAAYSYGMYNEITFTYRKLENGKVRIWRVE